MQPRAGGRAKANTHDATTNRLFFSCREISHIHPVPHAVLALLGSLLTSEGEEKVEEEEVVVESSFRGRERGGPRARPRYPGVEDSFRRATFLRETHPYEEEEEEERDKERGGGGGGFIDCL